MFGPWFDPRENLYTLLQIMSTDSKLAGRKRKSDAVTEGEKEIEVDLNAPEPPSKKSLRKAKKAKTEKKNIPTDPTTEVNEEASKLTATIIENDSASASKPKAMKAKKDASEYGIWIGNLAFFTTKDELTGFLTKPDTGISQQNIVRVNVPQGPPRNGKSQNKGFAYVDFASQEAQENAIALTEKLLGGRRVLIKGAKNFEGRPDKTEKDAASTMPSSKRIFVGNLGFDVTVDDLKQHFSQCGTVENVHIATFQDSGKCKGYAWVTFEELPAAEVAVRGWTDVPLAKDDIDGSDYEIDEVEVISKATKPRTKKIQINRIFGRKLRMEFAEDPTTRYKKRYGKGSGKDQDIQEFGDAQGSGSEDVQQPVSHKLGGGRGQEGKEGARTRSLPRQFDARKQDTTRYGRSTVDRLIGAAVAGEGKKTTFD